MPKQDRFWRKVDKGGRVVRSELGRCWEWTRCRSPDGYGRFGLGSAAQGTDYAHRVAWRLVKGEIPRGLFVLHRCDNPACCNPAHLFLGTQADNVADMIAKGRESHATGRKGTAHPGAKLSEDAVRDILASPNSNGELASKYGVARNTIRRIRRRSIWSHVETEQCPVYSTKRPISSGERNANARLTAPDVRSIRSASEGARELARRFGVSPTTIKDIRSGRSWSWLT